MNEPEITPRATGHCLCGAVRYQVHGPLRDVIVCHCRQCRRHSGHVAAYTRALRADLTIAEARGLAWYRPSAPDDSAQRGFCNQCGASLFWQMPETDTVSIAAGTLDAPTGLRTSHEIHLQDRSDYYEV